jgi:hypothetical protein
MFDRDYPLGRNQNAFDTDDFSGDNFVPESPARTSNSTPSSEGGALYQTLNHGSLSQQLPYAPARSQTPGALFENRLYLPNGNGSQHSPYTNGFSHGSLPMSTASSAYSVNRSHSASFQRSSNSPSVHTTAILQRLEQLEIAVKHQNTQITNILTRLDEDISNDGDSECHGVLNRRRKKKRKENGEPLYILSAPLRHLDPTQKSVRQCLQVRGYCTVKYVELKVFLAAHYGS